MDMQNKANKKNQDGLYAVIDPTGDLPFSDCEGVALSRLFMHDSLIDVGSKGTKDAMLKGLPGHSYIHFSGHGYYNFYDPTQSGLELANRSILTLEDLQKWKGNLSSARLVTLSACQTGISDVFFNNAEEFVGLPAGFMLAGVPCVVSSLWSVDDASTSMLMERFYTNHLNNDMDMPSALHEAQQWLRNLNSTEIYDYQKNYCSISSMQPDLKGDDKPYSDPFYWAAFTVNGA
jgi:CHAT domain-containing protein